MVRRIRVRETYVRIETVTETLSLRDRIKTVEVRPSFAIYSAREQSAMLRLGLFKKDLQGTIF